MAKPKKQNPNHDFGPGEHFFFCVNFDTELVSAGITRITVHKLKSGEFLVAGKRIPLGDTSFYNAERIAGICKTFEQMCIREKDGTDQKSNPAVD